MVDIDDEEAADAATSVEVALDESSFEAFFVACHADVERALTIALGDVELGRDATSEGFTRALIKWRKVSRYGNPAGWVYRVGLNWARSRRRKTVREVTYDAARRLPDMRAADPAIAASQTMLAALHTLSLEHRAVIVGRYYFDWSESQLSDGLGVAPGTVKSRLSRALQRLAQELETSDGTL